MFPGLPVHEVPDTGARYIKDAFVHNPGLLVRRGPVTDVPGMSSLPYPACGMVSVVDPTGATRVGVLHGDASHGYLGVYSADFTVRIDTPLGVSLGTSPYKVVQTAPRLNGGVWLSIIDKYAQGASQMLLLWKGGANGAYSSGTVTTAQGSTNVTGSGTSWRANVSAGMFLFSGGQYIGTVKSVNNDGSITLEKAALLTVTGATYTIQPFRGISQRVGKGFITTSTANTTVNGANTKFQADGLGTGTWDIFRSSDMTFIGTVASITSDIQLALTANASLNLDQEPYTAIRRDASYASQPTKLGSIPSVWAGRQAYANLTSDMESTSRVWFSSVDDAEAVDEATTDGDYIQVPSVGPAGVATPIVAMAPTPDSLLILKESEAYALFGQTTEQFSINPVSTDGCLSPMSVQPWNGLVIYAGRQGIYMYDGQQAINVTQQNLGWFYQSSVKNFDASKYRMWSMIDRDHYVLFIENVTPPIPVLKGTVTHPQTKFAIAMHLPTQAVTILENVNIRGSAQLPSSLVKGTWFVVNDASGLGHICSADTLFDSMGNDSFACDDGVAGPDFYLETKKYTIGDPLLKKLWKMLLMTYVCVGDTIRLDTVPGFNEIGTTSKTAFVTTGLTWQQLQNQGVLWQNLSGTYPTWSAPAMQFLTKRIKFLKRSQAMSFRFWQNSSNVTALVIGPWSIVMKPQRVGRV